MTLGPVRPGGPVLRRGPDGRLVSETVTTPATAGAELTGLDAGMDTTTIAIPVALRGGGASGATGSTTGPTTSGRPTDAATSGRAHAAGPTADAPAGRRRLSPSLVMASGTVVSRLTGFGRSALLLAAVGSVGKHPDVFNVPNTIPNALYILLAGGVFNAVLVPQLVRAMRNDPDGGEAYAQRIVTLAALFLAVVTAVLVLAAPLVVDLYLHGRFGPKAHASAVDFARLCLPQVFFYGMFVLVGQILNARRSFGPMMWAPIANNVIAIVVLGLYLHAYGSSASRSGFYAPHQELLLGLGSTLGVAAQLVILLPYLRAAGFAYRPRFDFRGTGLGRTARLSLWTLAFVVVNQLAYLVVVRLGSSGGALGQLGYTAYSFVFLVVMVPHAVVTVSLATAALPTLSARAAAGDLAGVGQSVARTLRQALAVMVPFAALMPLVAADLLRVLLHGRAAASVDSYATLLALFAPGVLLFTFHYLMLRGFYAIEANRTVFFNQLWVAGTNVVVALVLVQVLSPAHRAAGLVLAYGASYAVGGALSLTTLRRRLGGLDSARTLRFLTRALVATGVAAAVGGAIAYGLHVLSATPAWPLALVEGAVVAAGFGAVYLAMGRALHLREVTGLVDPVLARLRRR